MSAKDVDMIRRAASQIRDTEVAGMDPNEGAWKAVADLLDFIAPFAHQPNPYAPTVDHGLKIARAYLPAREEQP
jgi:hypothetical protein